jgi:hypothetical protein
MKKPWQLIVIALLFVLAGLVGLIYHLTASPAEPGIALVSIVRLIAVGGGIFLLLGRGWARWLLLAWMVVHVAVSAFHSISEFLPHVALTAVIGYVLFRPPVSTYFQSARSV